MNARDLLLKTDISFLIEKTIKDDFFLNYDKNKTEKEKEEIRNKIESEIKSWFDSVKEIDVPENKETFIYAVRDVDETLMTMMVTKEMIQNKTMERFNIPGFGFELTPQKEVLGYEVSPYSLETLPNDELAYSIFRDMTMFGISPEEQEKATQTRTEILEEMPFADSYIENKPKTESSAYSAFMKRFTEQLEGLKNAI